MIDGFAGLKAFFRASEAPLISLPPVKEMMHRSVAEADLIPGAGRDGPAYKNLGLLNGGFDVVAFGQIAGNSR